jgi:hypothetical protein
MGFRVAVVWIALLLAPLAHAQDAFVVPNSSEAVEGDANNTIPFTISGGNARYQQVYLDNDIPVGPFTIYGIAFRPDKLQQSFALEIPDVDIYLGTTVQSTNLNTQFANNVGPGYTLVASGPLALASAASGPQGGPLNFDIEIWFDPPFAYTGGNLLLDVFVQPSGLIGSPLFDAVNIVPDAVGRAYSAGLESGSVDATSGTADTNGLVTKFMLVPEPAGSAVAALAALAALVRARRHGSRNAAR